MSNPKVNVVITGFEARHYDEILDIVTLFQYRKFIRDVMWKETSVFPGARVAELGVGNGRNAILLSHKIGEQGKVVGFDISPDMLKRAREKTANYKNIEIEEHDIREKFDEKYHNYFDVALIAFAFHGFEDADKERIFENVRDILKNGGKFYILDYNQVDYSKSPIYFKILIDKFECPLAEKFLTYNLTGTAEKHGFKLTKKKTYFKDVVQYSEFTLEK